MRISDLLSQPPWSPFLEALKAQACYWLCFSGKRICLIRTLDRVRETALQTAALAKINKGATGPAGWERGYCWSHAGSTFHPGAFPKDSGLSFLRMGPWSTLKMKHFIVIQSRETGMGKM